MTEGQCAAARPLDARRETIMVQIEGELDHCSAGRVRATLDALIADPHVKRLVIDLEKLTFMDSSGIGMMIGRYKRMRSRGGTMGVMPGNARIERMMELSGLYQIVDKLA